MNHTLFIVGAGSVGGHITNNLSTYNLQYRHIYFLDDAPAKLNSVFAGYEVIGNVNYLLAVNSPVDVIIGIAFPKIKKLIFDRLKQNQNLHFPTIVSNNAWLSNQMSIAEGSIVYPNCSVNYGVNIDKFVVMNMNCAIGHDCTIGPFTSLAPGVSLGGHTHIGNMVEVGIGSASKQGVHIGNNAVIGGQSMIINNIDAYLKVVGVPARPIYSNQIFKKTL